MNPRISPFLTKVDFSRYPTPTFSWIKHVISCSRSVWDRQRCNRWIVPPDLLSDKRRWITMDDSRTQDHIRPRTTIEQVSESVCPANELGSIVLLLIYYHIQLKNVFVVCFDSDTLLNLL